MFDKEDGFLISNSDFLHKGPIFEMEDRFLDEADRTPVSVNHYETAQFAASGLLFQKFVFSRLYSKFY